MTETIDDSEWMRPALIAIEKGLAKLAERHEIVCTQLAASREDVETKAQTIRYLEKQLEQCRARYEQIAEAE